MSPDEADMDLGLQDKLDATEVEKIRTLHEGVKYKTIVVYNFAESQELIRLQNTWLSSYQTLLAKRSPTANIWLQYMYRMYIIINSEAIYSSE